jgi:hypothetical protein
MESGRFALDANGSCLPVDPSHDLRLSAPLPPGSGHPPAPASNPPTIPTVRRDLMMAADLRPILALADSVAALPLTRSAFLAQGCQLAHRLPRHSASHRLLQHPGSLASLGVPRPPLGQVKNTEHTARLQSRSPHSPALYDPLCRHSSLSCPQTRFHPRFSAHRYPMRRIPVSVRARQDSLRTAPMPFPMTVLDRIICLLSSG